jgi:hypothetical protein
MNIPRLTCLTDGHNWRAWPHPSVPGGWVVIRCTRCGRVQDREASTPWTA